MHTSSRTLPLPSHLSSSTQHNAIPVEAAPTMVIELNTKEADHNVKLILLERVNQLRRKNEGVPDNLAMEILRILSSPDIEVIRKSDDSGLNMMRSKAVNDIIQRLKKEFANTVDQEYEKNNEIPSVAHPDIQQCTI